MAVFLGIGPGRLRSDFFVLLETTGGTTDGRSSSLESFMLLLGLWDLRRRVCLDDREDEVVEAVSNISSGLPCIGLNGLEMSKMGLVVTSSVKFVGKGERFWLKRSDMSQSSLTSEAAENKLEVGVVACGIADGPGDCFLTLFSRLFRLNVLSISIASAAELQEGNNAEDEVGDISAFLMPPALLALSSSELESSLELSSHSEDSEVVCLLLAEIEAVNGGLFCSMGLLALGLTTKLRPPPP